MEIKNGYHARQRIELLNAYGGKCECCGESTYEFLVLDHPKEDGHEQRKIHGSSVQEHYYLKREGYPKGNHRVLCHNCNAATYLYGYCPHQVQRFRTQIIDLVKVKPITRTEIICALNRHITSKELNSVLMELERQGLVKLECQKQRIGRPKTVVFWKG